MSDRNYPLYRRAAVTLGVASAILMGALHSRRSPALPAPSARVMDLCILNNVHAPLPPASIDSAIALATRTYAPHGITIAVTERGWYRGAAVTDILGYLSGAPDAVSPRRFCSLPHTAVGVYNGYWGVDPGNSDSIEPVFTIFANTLGVQTPVHTTVHEIGHLLGLDDTDERQSYMYHTLEDLLPALTGSMADALRRKREELDRGVDSTLARSTRSETERKR